MKDLVIMKERQAVTTSLMIAEVFGKEHRNVIQAIESKIRSAENSAHYNSMFYEGTYVDGRNREQKQYFMNRDGFTFIAFGFTGKEADKFKLKYIEAFNQMEKSLNNRQLSRIEILELALIAEKENEALKLENSKKDQVIGELKPKADYTDRILKSKSLVTVSQIAKDYGMSAQELNKKLFELGVQYKQSGQWLLYAKHQAKGYTHSETINITRADGRSDVTMNTKWTQKGRLFLYNILKENGIVPIIEQE